MRAPAQIRIATVAALAALAGCAGPTPYQPLADGYGYSDQVIETNRYRVTFAGNSSTPRSTVENYLLYRAAEITLAQGHDHFVVVHHDTERSTTYSATTDGLAGHHVFGGFGHRHTFAGFATTTARPRDEYEAFMYVLMRRGEKPADHPHAYDAREVVRNLRPEVERKPDS